MNQPPNNWLPSPVPPVSPPGPPQPHGAAGNTGVIYGTQQKAVWLPGARLDAREVLDLKKPEALWRVSVFGRVLVRINYGTLAARQISNLRTPIVITVPGQCTVTAQPLDDEGTICIVTATQATAGARSIARQLVGTTAPTDLLFDEGAVDFFALTASSLVISGSVVAVPALSVVPLVAGSRLTNGSGFVEYEA
jgi:hypothetical protein